MAGGKIRIRHFRETGHKHKKNKMSVVERKKIKRLLARRQREEAKKNQSTETLQSN